MDKPWPSRRSAPTVRRGDVREQQILDGAEELLSTAGHADMTVSDITAAAGITRGALYFYFGSKQEVLTALVARTSQVLNERAASARTDTGPVPEVIAAALQRTADLWLEHGPVMRMAVDLSATVPDIDRLWSGAAEISIDAITAVLERAGVPSGDAPSDAPALARALCWMIERSFYQASKVSATAVDDARLSCQTVWSRVVGL
ncbi:TetR/AcrR family transcriptional regulator [Mycolicibacterium monacense]|uniref:TetR/AcrR family transcriptional regulator n=1 Tax=Mycolicibacterium monacense TaxID=85693 RepID=UPI0007EC1B3F|nr:TetR/AcrR family transcriptional regulator [Mycolicibacterium monacense]OBB77812.1 TetR family transcriptional regulator [Mycolicibacterium monacense]